MDVWIVNVCTCVQAALSESDLLVTVSPNYAREIQSDEGMACGMRDVLCARGIWCACTSGLRAVGTPSVREERRQEGLPCSSQIYLI